MTEPH